MPINPVNYIVNNICEFFIDGGIIEKKLQDRNFRINRTLIRMHSCEKLKQHGDISFPCNVHIWQRFFSKIRHEAFDALLKAHELGGIPTKCDFLDAAAKWLFPIEHLDLQNERCILYLQRSVLIGQLLPRVLAAQSGDGDLCYGHFKKNPKYMINITYINSTGQMGPDSNTLSLYRAKLLYEILCRVLACSEWTIVTEANFNATSGEQIEKKISLLVHSVEQQIKHLQRDNVTKSVSMVSGIVIEPIPPKTKTKMTTKEYLNLRANDIKLTAMHKCGLRPQQDTRFNALMQLLGEAAVTVDLMEVKHSSPVQLVLTGQGSTKGAAFILYNSARLETLLRTFEEQVNEGVYGPLPDIQDVDLSLLNEEEEWQIIFGHIFAYPNLIERCLEQLERGLFAIHLIVRYLNDFVAIFSVYYRRVRILIHRRDHLMPLVHARIYLLKAIRYVLNKTLGLLDIAPVEFM